MKKTFETITLSKDGLVDIGKFIIFLKESVGLDLAPVFPKSSLNPRCFWLEGKGGSKLIDGDRYYKLQVDNHKITLIGKGSYNTYALKSHLIGWLKEAVNDLSKPLDFIVKRDDFGKTVPEDTELEI